VKIEISNLMHTLLLLVVVFLINGDVVKSILYHGLGEYSILIGCRVSVKK